MVWYRKPLKPDFLFAFIIRNNVQKVAGHFCDFAKSLSTSWKTKMCQLSRKSVSSTLLKPKLPEMSEGFFKKWQSWLFFVFLRKFDNLLALAPTGFLQNAWKSGFRYNFWRTFIPSNQNLQKPSFKILQTWRQVPIFLQKCAKRPFLSYIHQI